MKTIFSTGTMLVLCGLYLNTVAAEPLIKDQQPDRSISLSGQHKLQDSKQFDRTGHENPGNVKDVSNAAAQSTDDDCE